MAQEAAEIIWDPPVGIKRALQLSPVLTRLPRNELTFLDLGGGSDEPDYLVSFPPSDCRRVGPHFKTTVNIDLGEVDEAEHFVHLQTDIVPLLREPNQLIQLLTENNIVPRFHIVQMNSVLGANPSPSIDLTSDEREQLEYDLFQAAKNLLLEGGVLVFNNTFYIKNGDQLVQH